LAEARKTAEEAAGRAARAKEALDEATERARVAEEAFAEADRVRERVEQIAIERRTLEEQASTLLDRRTDLEGRIEELRKDIEQLATLEEEQRALADAGETLLAARRAVEGAEEARLIESELEALPAIDAESALASLKTAEEEREAARESAARAKSELERANDELADATQALERASVADPSEPCPTCGRPLGDDFKQYVAHCKEEVRRRKRAVPVATKSHREAAAALKSAETNFREATRQGEEVREALGRRAGLTAHLEKARAKLADASEAFAGGVPDDLSELEARARRAKEVEQRLSALGAEAKHLVKAEQDLQHLMGDLERCSVRLEALNREEAELAFDPEDHDRIRKENDEARRVLDEVRIEEREMADLLSRAQARVKELQAEIRKVKEIGERVTQLREDARYLERVSLLLDGFRDHLVGRIGPELSREAEVLFRELTNHEYDDLRIREEDLSIQIADAGAYFDIERFSGSETDLANLALRVAISMHLSRVSGADIGMMVLDEVLGSLDAERKDLMVQAMGKLSGRFHQLFVITHAELVKDQFPASIQVRKVGRRRSTAVLV
jgi:exonuclease SbcC